MNRADIAAVLIAVLANTVAGQSLDPTNPPGPTMRTLQEIFDKVADVEQTVTGLVPHTLQDLSDTTTTVEAGHYAATNLTEVDVDLATGNIRYGTVLFGVPGKTEVVDTTSGDAEAGDIATGMKAWVDGIEVTGTGTLSSAAAPVPNTGQTNSCQTGDDADCGKGVPWPNPRFTVGTGSASNCVTDNLTGLMWLKNCGPGQTWDNAVAYCNGLDGSSGRGGYTDWRLPNVRELRSLIDYGQVNPALPPGHPFTGVQLARYWSSTTWLGQSSMKWTVYLNNGFSHDHTKGEANCVWPVRGGD